jgi:hypothetical protein
MSFMKEIILGRLQVSERAITNATKDATLENIISNNSITYMIVHNLLKLRCNGRILLVNTVNQMKNKQRRC